MLGKSNVPRDVDAAGDEIQAAITLVFIRVS
jgi:hypothetical protein